MENRTGASWDKLVTWNGIEFDVPFLKVRSRFLGIEPDESINTAKFRSPADTNHVDCMWLLRGRSDDIPLEVCKTCIKAKSTASEEGLKVSRVPREEAKEAAAPTAEARGESELSSEWSDLSGDSRLQKLEKAREKHMEELK